MKMKGGMNKKKKPCTTILNLLNYFLFSFSLVNILLILALNKSSFQGLCVPFSLINILFFFILTSHKDLVIFKIHILYKIQMQGPERERNSSVLIHSGQRFFSSYLWMRGSFLLAENIQSKCSTLGNST